MTKAVTILGATGSIGQSTLDVIKRHPHHFELYAVTANNNVEQMLEICQKFNPQMVVMAEHDAAQQLQKLLTSKSSITVLAGESALEQVASAASVDIVMAAIVGAVGLMPTLAAVRAGKRVCLANKEALVMAGHLFMHEVKSHNAELMPIDSEHNAIFQCLPSMLPGKQDTDILQRGVTKILLTGSGGPFRVTPVDELPGVTPEQAIAHPNWSMGPKISVDSATMMNKGLELIEACWLFDVAQDDVEIVLHPQSIIHSMVSYNDGSVLAQMGNPDMRTPIAHAMAWPERIESGVEPLDLFKVSQLNFENADEQRYPCLRLAREAIAAGGTSMAILNAANEIAVEAFLDRRIGFTRIAELIEDCLEKIPSHVTDSLNQIIDDDRQARQYVASQLD